MMDCRALAALNNILVQTAAQRRSDSSALSNSINEQDLRADLS